MERETLMVRESSVRRLTSLRMTGITVAIVTWRQGKACRAPVPRGCDIHQDPG